MRNRHEKTSTSTSHEGPPFLQVVKVKANSVDEAMEKAGGGAGQAELDWVLANPKEARKMLKGDNYFFFPEAADGLGVPFVCWSDGLFWQDWCFREFRWRSNDRVVQLG